jgi:hypothetical protein
MFFGEIDTGYSRPGSSHPSAAIEPHSASPRLSGMIYESRPSEHMRPKRQEIDIPICDAVVRNVACTIQ